MRFWWCVQRFEDAQPARSGHSIRCTASHLLGGRDQINRRSPLVSETVSQSSRWLVVMQSNGRGSPTSEGDLCLRSCMMWVGHADADGRDICIRYKMTTDALVSNSRRNCQWAAEMFVALKLSQASLWPAENKLSMQICL